MEYKGRHSRLWERYDEATHSNAQQMHDILVEVLDALEKAEGEISRLRDYAEVEACYGDKAAENGVMWMKRYHALKKAMEQPTLTEDHQGNRMNMKIIAYTHPADITNMQSTGLFLRGWPTDRFLNEEDGFTVPLYMVAPEEKEAE